MKIEQGKFYRTRGGVKVHVTAVCVPSRFCTGEQIYLVRGYTEDGDSETWTIDGLFQIGKSHDADLVDEWPEPVSKTCIAALYRLQDGVVGYRCFDDQFSVNQYIQRNNATLLDSKEITLTEQA